MLRGRSLTFCLKKSAPMSSIHRTDDRRPTHSTGADDAPRKVIDHYAAIRWARRQRQIENKVAKNVLNVLATYANRDGTGAWPSQEELAADTGFSVRAVRRALVELEQDRYLQRRERQRKNGSRSSDEYRLNLAWPSEFPDDEWGAVPAAGARATGTAGQARRTPTTDLPAPESGPTTFDQPGYLPEDPSSEPVGSAPPRGPAIRDFRKELFERGVADVAALTGRPSARCRTLIGQWLKLVRDDARIVLATIDEADAAEAIDPVGWIEARLRRRTAGVGTAPPAAPDLVSRRRAEAVRMAERGEWPLGGSVFVAADSPEGLAWERYFAGFGKRPKWMALGGGLGWHMPSAMPPVRPVLASA